MIRRLPSLAILFASAIVSGLPAQGPAGLGADLSAWYASASRSAPGRWGIVVADDGGEVLWSVNPTEPMIPASTVKLLTTGFARTVVGGDARRATRVVGDGQVNPVTGAWEGGWALELNGDPTFERAERGGPMLTELARQLAAIGVRRLSGPLTITTAMGEPKSSYPAAWESRHRGRIFAPPVGPVTLNENIVGFSVAPGARAGQAPIIISQSPSGISNIVTMNAKTVAGSRRAIRFSVRPNGHYVVSGTIGVRAGSLRYVGVPADPRIILDAAWLAATRSAGIQWVQAPLPVSVNPAARRILAEVASQPFDSIAHEVNARSLNIGAELLLLWGGGPNGAAERLTQHVRTVTGITAGVHLVDGSGLSGSDRVSPLVFTTYLARFPLTPAGKNFPLLLPTNGSGTLRRLATGLPGPGVVRAKTGTLGNASTLVGYLGRADGTLLIAVMYNGASTGAARAAQWELFRKLGANGIVIPNAITPTEALGSTPDSLDN